MILGDSAGFVNMLKIKGLHNAIDSGIQAAKAIVASLDKPDTAAAEVHGQRRAVEHRQRDEDGQGLPPDGGEVRPVAGHAAVGPGRLAAEVPRRERLRGDDGGPVPAQARHDLRQGHVHGGRRHAAPRGAAVAPADPRSDDLRDEMPAGLRTPRASRSVRRASTRRSTTSPSRPTRPTACTARPASASVPSTTSAGPPPKAAAARATNGCKNEQPRARPSTTSPVFFGSRRQNWLCFPKPHSGLNSS